LAEALRAVELADEGDLLALEAVRVAAAVVAFVMLGRHLERGGRDVRRDFEDLPACHDMAAHDGEFLVGELARLVEDAVGRLHLADIVQQAAHAGPAKGAPRRGQGPGRRRSAAPRH
jgi:hypothetical protein